MRDYSALGKLGGRPRRKSWAEIEASRNQPHEVIKNKETKIKRKRRKVESVGYEAKVLMELVKLEYREKPPGEDVRSSSPVKEGD